MSGIMNLKVKLYWPAFIPCELSKLNVFLLEDAEVNDNNINNNNNNNNK